MNSENLTRIGKEKLGPHNQLYLLPATDILATFTFADYLLPATDVLAT